MGEHLLTVLHPKFCEIVRAEDYENRSIAFRQSDKFAGTIVDFTNRSSSVTCRVRVALKDILYFRILTKQL